MDRFVVQYQDKAGQWRKKEVVAESEESARKKFRKKTKSVLFVLSVRLAEYHAKA